MSIQSNMSQARQPRRSDQPESTARPKAAAPSAGAPNTTGRASSSASSIPGQSCAPSSDLERALLAEIERLGGDERTRGARGALDMFHAALSELIAQNPKEYGAGDDPESQQRAISHLLESVKTPFLAQTVAGMRQKAGYVLVFGYWLHRAVFTFVGFGLLAAVVLPLCAVSLMSTRAWGWLPGAVGIVAALGAGAWILTRIRTK